MASRFHFPPDQGGGLIDAADSVLCVIDVQDVFLDKIPQKRQRVLNNVCWLIEAARWLEIPLVVMGEEVDRQPLAEELIEKLPPHQPVFNKLVFGLAGQADILQAVRETARQTAVLVGLETDVCVLHSALGLQAEGYRVVVVADAVGTPAPHHQVGLERMRQAGVTITDVKGLFYEWMRTVAQVDRFHQALPHMREAAGIVL